MEATPTRRYKHVSGCFDPDDEDCPFCYSNALLALPLLTVITELPPPTMLLSLLGMSLAAPARALRSLLPTATTT